MQRLTICFSFLLCPLLLVFGQETDIDVIWQHGLGGDLTSWETLANQFQVQREMNSVRPNVTTSEGVLEMAEQITISPVTVGTDSDHTIGIGHSMGGVAFREIARRTAPGFVDAVVTVGSPLNGAEISDALFDGTASGYFRHGVEELQKGPRRQFTISYIILRELFFTFIHITARDIHEVLFTQNGFDELVFTTASANRGVVDLAVGSEYMRTARALNPEIPKVSIYGNENRPVHYRMAASFSGTPEDEIVRTVNDIIGVYDAFYQINRSAFFGIFGRWQASGWKSGRDYLRHGSETGWNTLIGASRLEESRVCSRQLVCSLMEYSERCVIGDSDDCCMQEVCTTGNFWFNEESDGLINKSSQLGELGASLQSAWLSDRNFEVVGANHVEQREHPGVRERLVEIFDARNNLSELFRVEIR
jgi:pimeloyl-ACP methyl ester carboxylesterase